MCETSSIVALEMLLELVQSDLVELVQSDLVVRSPWPKSSSCPKE